MTAHAPILDYDRARAAMLDSQLRPEGVNDPAVLSAMGAVPREQFVPEEVRPLAYMDRSIPLGDGRFLAPAAALGLLLTQLAPKPGERALVIGCGTGYALAVLDRMGLEAAGVESAKSLASEAKAKGLMVHEGALEAGFKKGAPFDLLLVDGAIEVLPDALIAQLDEGGRFGGGLVEEGVSRLTVGRKAAGGFGCYSIADFNLPRLPGFQRPRTFTF